MRTKLIGTAARINGLCRRALARLIRALGRTASLGRYRFRVRNQWLDGGHTRTTVTDFFGAATGEASRRRPLVVESDLPSLLGGDRALDPLEHLLAALAASVTATLACCAAIQGIHLDAIDTSVEGDIDVRGALGFDPAMRPGYQAIRVIVTLESEATDATLDRIVEQGIRCSPVFDTIRRGTRVRVQRDRPARR